MFTTIRRALTALATLGSPRTPLTASGVLLRAREVMNNGGQHWAKGQLRMEDHLGIQRFCALGGLNEAAGLPQLYADGSGPNETYDDEGMFVPLTGLEGLVAEGRARIKATHYLAEVIEPDSSLFRTAPKFRSDHECEAIIIEFNDHGTWEAVEAKLVEAAALAKSRGE